MKKSGKFHRWSLEEDDLADLSPAKARDLIIKCFYESQKETFLSARRQLGVRSSDEDIHASVVAGVQLAFRETGGDFEHPTREGLMKVVDVLAKKSSSWGTPPDIIQHHICQIRKIVDRLQELEKTEIK
ncbi:MAG: hypothetical protein HY755_06915 [Nitrospirae bacterium]|nr:hypothetical protein [Nitrospirota bacterium]